MDLGLAVLEFNADQFSDSPWVYESLGEAYIMTGDKEKAVQNLRKVLDIDPNNINVRKKLNELEKDFKR